MNEQRIAEIDTRANKVPLIGYMATVLPSGGEGLDWQTIAVYISQLARKDIPDLIAAWREQQQRIAELEAERDGLRAVADAAKLVAKQFKYERSCDDMPPLKLMFGLKLEQLEDAVDAYDKQAAQEQGQQEGDAPGE